MADPQSLYFQIQHFYFNKSFSIKANTVSLHGMWLTKCYHAIIIFNILVHNWHNCRPLMCQLCTSSESHMVAANIFTKTESKFEISLSLFSLLSCLCVHLFVCVDFLSTCKLNKGIYSAMRLDKVFNISSFLNTTVVSNLDSPVVAFSYLCLFNGFVYQVGGLSFYY